MNASDHADLPPLFADAFERVPPFGGLNCTQRLSASRLALEKTWTGGDGPWLPGASFTAVHSQKTTPLGGITITLVPGGDPSDSACYRWEDPEHIAIKDRATAQPHLTWIFVSPVWRSGGIASACWIVPLPRCATWGIPPCGRPLSLVMTPAWFGTGVVVSRWRPIRSRDVFCGAP